MAITKCSKLLFFSLDLISLNFRWYLDLKNTQYISSNWHIFSILKKYNSSLKSIGRQSYVISRWETVYFLLPFEKIKNISSIFLCT